MKRWQFYTAMCLGLLCVGLSVALVGMAYLNQKLQKQLQGMQVQLNSSILAPQAQQIAGNVLQEMGTIAATNDQMRALLAKHGYTLKQNATEAISADEAESGGEE